MGYHLNAPPKLPFSVGDTVRTPSGRLARVADFIGERVSLRYVNDGGPVLLLPHLVILVHRRGEQ